MIDFNRYETIKELFNRAIELSPSERSSFLDRECPGDDLLRREVEELLQAANTSEQRLEDYQQDLVDVLSRRSEEEDPPPEDIGSYRITGKLGQGGMGEVFEVWDSELERSLALKLMKPPSLDAPEPSDGGRLRRFLSEARITGQLDHPGIVPVHNLGHATDGPSYFTMPVIKGLTFEAIIDRVRRGDDEWRLPRALGVLLRANDAVAYAHSKGVINRDIKPSNIMVGEFGEVYVVDWGIAKSVASSEAESAQQSSPVRSSQQTQQGDVVGTPSYMSPEQAKGEVDNTTFQADIYGMGATLYHLLVGMPPYVDKQPSGSGIDILTHVRSGPPTPLESLRSDLPSELVAICDKAMHRDSEKRYPGLGEFGRDLRAYLENRVVQAYRTGPWIEFVKWMQRNRLAASALLAVGLTLAAALAVSFVLLRLESDARQQAEAHANVFESFLTSPDPYRDGSKDITVRDLLDSSFAPSVAVLSKFPMVRLRYEWTVARVRSNLGDWDQAYELLQSLVPEFENVYGPVDERTIRARHLKAYSLFGMGRFAEAKSAHQSDVDFLQSQRQVDPFRFAVSLAGVARCCTVMGDFAEAERVYEALSDVQRQFLGEENAEVLLLRAIASMAKVESGETTVAIETNDDVLRAFQSLSGTPLGHVATVHFNLGLAYYRRIDLDNAETHFEKARDLHRKFYGSDHNEALSAGNGLGLTLLKKGEFDRAEALLLEVSQGFLQNEGPEHHDTLLSQNNLALCYASMGRVEEAIAIWKEIQEIQRRVLGPDHPHTLQARFNMALFQRGTKPADEIVEELRDIAQSYERTLGIDSTETLRVWAAYYAVKQRPVEELLRPFRRIVGLQEARLGNHRDVVESKSHLALMEERASQELGRLLQVTSFDVNNRVRCSVLLRALDRPEESLDLLQDALTQRDLTDEERTLLELERIKTLLELEDYDLLNDRIFEVFEGLDVDGQTGREELSEILRTIVHQFDQAGRDSTEYAELLEELMDE